MNKEPTPTGIIAPDLEKQFHAIFAPIRNDAIKDAAIYGRKNQPAPDAKAFLAIGLIKTRCEGGYAQMMNSIKSEVYEAKYLRAKADTAKRAAEIDASIAELEHGNLLDARDLSGTEQPFASKRNPFLIAALVLIYLGEAYFNALAFEFLGTAAAGSFFLGTMVAGIEAALSYQIAKYIARIETEEKKPYIQTTFYILINLMIVIAMSVLRARVIEDMETAVPAWIFFCINITLLVGSVIFSKMVFPSQKESDARRQLRERYEKIKEREKEIGNLRKELTELGEEDEQAEFDYQFIKSQVAHIGHLTRAQYREIVEVAKAENSINRSDGAVPSCFSAPSPELRLTTPNLH